MRADTQEASWRRAGIKRSGMITVQCMRSLALVALLAVACGSAGASPPSTALSTPTRSAVAGSWTLSIATTDPACVGVLHLAGPDDALIGAWNCFSTFTGEMGGTLTGETSGSSLRLNLFRGLQPGTSFSSTPLPILVDATIAADGKSASGTGVTGSTIFPFSIAAK